MILPEVGEGAVGQAKAHRGKGGGRDAVASALVLALVAALIGALAIAFEGSSWWYSYGEGYPLDDEVYARLTAVRDEVVATGAVPEAVTWLNAALDTNADSTAVRAYLSAAVEALEAGSDLITTRAAEEVAAIIEALNGQGSATTGIPAGTPYVSPTLNWSE